MTKRMVLLASSLALIVAGCATSIPTEDNQAINAAEEAIATAAARDDVRQYAPVELQKAEDNLEEANAAFAQGNRAAGEHYAYLSQRQAQLAEAIASEAAARAEATRINKAREELRLQTRNQALESQQAEIEQLREQLSELEPEETDRGIVLTISNVLFDVDSAELSSAAQAPLDRLANYLRENTEQQVQVEGYTDSTGSDEYNQDLSERRADSVAAAMIERGVDSSRMMVEGYGEARPVASNDTQTGRQQNRRVEFVLLN